MSGGSSQKKLFNFKQFSLSDAGCGMKIGTDGVLLGSVAAQYASRGVLDIGTGCGLIALMLAQKTQGKITAIDIDPNAVAQARENVANSPWSERVRVKEVSLQDFCKKAKQKYSLVVCNPPYFHNCLQSPLKERSLARHSISLTPDELLDGVTKITEEKGHFILILPFNQANDFICKAKQVFLFCSRMIRVKPIPDKVPVRAIMVLNYKLEQKTGVEELVIESGGRHQYSQEYRTLTGDYYPAF